MYIIGVFECGCSCEANYSGTEIVRCSNEREANNIVALMKKHSEGFQCKGASASSIIIINETHGLKFILKDKDTKYWNSPDKYIKCWKIRHAETIKSQKRMTALEKKLKLMEA